MIGFNKKEKKIDNAKIDKFLVVDVCSYLKNTPFICSNYSDAFDIAFAMIKECYKAHLSSYGVVIYCFEERIETFPVIVKFITLGEIVEELCKNKGISKDEIINEDLTLLSGLVV